MMNISSWHSYPKIYGLGHGIIKELLFDEVVVEEKLDGSQFSFGVFNGEIKMKSNGAEIFVDDPEKMFIQAVETVKRLKDKLIDGYTYRAEYFQRPKHNVLAYDRIPVGHLILFDINPSEETYLSHEEKRKIADELGLETVPLLYQGRVENPEKVMAFLELTSCLGGQKIEGVVIKNYNRFGPDKKALMGKYVSEAFKEKHKVDWKEGNPKQGDILERIINGYRTPARWDKAIIHLKEKGQLEGTARDIGNLIKEAKEDLRLECEAEIKQLLFDWAFPNISRSITAGLPEYYKQKLLENQFS